ncbi:hypothetical protein RB596_003211 [Gaeumannomyces avenae]
MAARWGSLFQQAVTGLEARLDTILADEEEKAKASQAQATSGAAGATAAAATSSTTAPTPTPASAKSSPSLSRSGSTNRTQDRLQERLVRAVAAKNASAGSRPEPSPSRNSFTSSPRQSLDVPSRGSMDGGELVGKSPQEPASRRTSQDTPNRTSLDTTEADPALESQAQAVPATAAKEEEVVGQETTCDAPRKSADLERTTTPVPAIAIASDVPVTEALSAAESEALASLEKQSDMESDDVQKQHQEEIHHYVEKIDALQAKLQYLAREAADAAKKAAQTAPSGSLEKKLAEKDHQIALLMEEGKALGVTEQKHRTIMKKLRIKVTEDEKEINNLKASVAKADAEAEAQRRLGRRAKDLEKFHEESLKRIGQLQKDINSLRTESSSKDSTIADLRAQLQQANENAESLNARANQEALEKERRRVKELEDEVATLKVEKDLAADRARAQASELKEKAERATERARVVEAELKAEAQAMESKLEAMRTRAEETSSGALGDSQAKLLRQVETLQTQYAIASDNWQGIEATLLGRISNLEKERDEAQQRESDMRKKAREAATRAKRNEEELEEARSKLPTAQQDIESYQKQLEALKKRAEQAEATLQEARVDFDKQKAFWKDERRQGTGSADRNAADDRRGWLEDVAQQQPFRSNSRPDSPLLLPPARTWSSDMLGFHALSGKLRKPSAPSSNGDGAGDRGMARRPSAQPSHRPSIAPSTAGSYHLTPGSTFSASIESLPAPGAHPMDQEDMDGVETGSTHQVVQDMVSVSTVGAGPSVQLVERMSAQVRRLESERVAGREELARMSKQRDEARVEIVALMREIEAGKEARERVAKLEAEVAEVNARYETTLEMLGEKSEMVEELKADVQDVKAMYRELIESTLK